MSGNSKNLAPLNDRELLWLIRNRLEFSAGLVGYEKYWLEKLADRFEALVQKEVS